jgi:hypothetical protein
MHQPATGRYRTSRLREFYPIINFMLLKYSDKTREVMFGWGHHPEELGGAVFMSRNKELVEVFDRFWRTLERDSLPYNGSKDDDIVAADIAGLWYSAAYSKDGRVPQMGIPSGAVRVNDALIGVTIDRNRNIVINGSVHEAGKNDRDLKSVAADLTGNMLWYAENGSHDAVFNAGWCRFLRSAGQQSRRGVARVEHYYGTIAEPTNAEEPGHPEHFVIRELMLFGERVTKTWPPEAGLTEDPRDLPLDTAERQNIVELCRATWDPVRDKRWKDTAAWSPVERQ